MLKRYLTNKQGQGMSEYLILVLLIAVGSIAATQSLGSTVFKKIKQVQQKIQDVNFSDVQEK
jgi:Flp pilus assembly pilin Flp